MMTVFLIILALVAVLFLLTFAVYFFNLDMKLIYKLHQVLKKHYDALKKDRRL